MYYWKDVSLGGASLLDTGLAVFDFRNDRTIEALVSRNCELDSLWCDLCMGSVYKIIAQ